MRSVLRLRQLAIQNTWCRPQRPARRHNSTADPFFAFPDGPSTPRQPLEPRLDPYNELFWRRSPTPSTPTHDDESRTLHSLRSLLHSPSPRTQPHCNHVWSVYTSLPLVTRRALPLTVHKLLLTRIIPPPPDRESVEGIRPPHLPRDVKGKGREEVPLPFAQTRAKMMDAYRSEMDKRLKSVVSDMAGVDKLDLLNVLKGLMKTGNVYQLEGVVGELTGRLNGDYNWLRRDIAFTKLDTVLTYLKSALREKRTTSRVQQHDILKILWDELRGFTQDSQGKVDRKILRKMTSCLYYANVVFENTDHAPRLDGMLSMALEKVYGFDRRFLRVVEREKFELWDARVVAVLMGWMGRRGEGWKMVAALEGLAEAVWEDGLVVKEEIVQVDEFDWRGRRKTGYFEENHAEASVPVEPVVAVDTGDIDGLRKFNDYYTTPLPHPRPLVNHAALHVMMKHANENRDLDLGLHIARMGLVYAKEEQARWIADVQAVSQGANIDLHPPTLHLHRVPIRSLYLAARTEMRRKGHNTSGWLFKEIHLMLKDVQERLEMERAVLFESNLLQQLNDRKVDPEAYESHLTDQQAVVKDLLEVSERTREAFLRRHLKKQETKERVPEFAEVEVEPVMVRRVGWDQTRMSSEYMGLYPG